MTNPEDQIPGLPAFASDPTDAVVAALDRQTAQSVVNTAEAIAAARWRPTPEESRRFRRFEAASRFLPALSGFWPDKEKMVQVAVETADLLLAELEKEKP